MKKVLLTGAAGIIGGCLRRDLGPAFDFRCFDLVPVVGADDTVVGDITERQTVLRAMRGVDAVIHLAANPELEQPFEDVISSGIQGTRCVLEAARQEGVERVIYASSAHVSGWREIDTRTRITVDSPVTPRTYYGMGKLFCEHLARLYAEQHGMTVVCLRVGAFHDQWVQPMCEDNTLLRTWCSGRDLAQLVRRSLEAPPLGFVIFYGISGNRRRLWDISNARRLVGFEPEDDAERFCRATPFWQRIIRWVRGRRVS